MAELLNQLVYSGIPWGLVAALACLLSLGLLLHR